MFTKEKTLTGAKIVIEALKNLGVDTIFGYPGGIVLSIYDELFAQNDIKHVLVRHEQAAVHAAEGYARVTGKCGVVLVTSGPGATNTVSGIVNAYLDGFPLVVLTGQVMAHLIGKDAFQEANICDITKSCTKKVYQVTSAKDLEETLYDAFYTAQSGKKGPVVVDMAKNILSETAEFSGDITAEHSELKIVVSENKIDNAAEALLNSKRPVLVAGGGVLHSNAEKELLEFAKRYQLPVVSTMMALGTYPQNNPEYLGIIGIFGQMSANQALRESDLIFSAGARFNDRITCCFPNGELKRNFIQLDINENEISRSIPASISLIGDAKEILVAMNDKAVNNLMIDRTEWISYTIALKDKNLKRDKKSELLHSFEVMREVQKFIEGKGIVVTTEVGQHQLWAAQNLKFSEPRKFLTSGGSGTMGFGFPAAIGAAFAAPSKPVICVTGDGSFQMNIQELATCKDYNLPVKILILNNGYLGMVRQLQEKFCNKRYSETKISNPDFLKIAESYGIYALRVDKKEDVIPALQKVVSFDGSCIIDFVIEPMEVL